MSKNWLLIDAHPFKDSFCSALADSYADGVPDDINFQRINLRDLNFDAILTKEKLNGESSLEADLLNAQKQISWANHIIFVYPTWWGGPPALLKGFFDKTFSSGFAFQFKENFCKWDKLLDGRTAELIVTMDTPPLLYNLMYGGHMMLKNSILGFCGIKVKKILNIGPVTKSSLEEREKWLKKAKSLAENHLKCKCPFS